MADTITFALAFLAYLLVCAGAILYAWGRYNRLVVVSAAITALVHVGLVWGWRFGWSVEHALAKGWAGFVLFHIALAVILSAALAQQPWSGRIIAATFPLVTAGALGAVLKYEVVAGYLGPLVVTASMTILLASFGALRRRGPRNLLN